MLGATGQSYKGAFHADKRNEIFSDIRNYANAVAEINAKSAGPKTCVFVPPPQAGLGCKYVLLPSGMLMSFASSIVTHYRRLDCILTFIGHSDKISFCFRSLLLTSTGHLLLYHLARAVFKCFSPALCR